MRLSLFYSAYMIATAIAPTVNFNQFGLALFGVIFLLFDIMDFGGRKL
jgi:hypothetical protein